MFLRIPEHAEHELHFNLKELIDNIFFNGDFFFEIINLGIKQMSYEIIPIKNTVVQLTFNPKLKAFLACVFLARMFSHVSTTIIWFISMNRLLASTHCLL